MNENAQPAWKDRAGGSHDTVTGALAASRSHLIRLKMEHVYLVGGPENQRFASNGLRWLLSDPLIIGQYQTICTEVDEQMATTKD